MGAFDIRIQYLMARGEDMKLFAYRVESIINIHGEPEGEARKELDNYLDNWPTLVAIIVQDPVYDGLLVRFRFYDHVEFVSYDHALRNWPFGDGGYQNPVIYNMKSGTRWDTNIAYRTLPVSNPTPDGVWA